ncbi:MAG: MiaB/RimO family radical SAM methylthiotransferase, partial [Tidjanibacter sp.]|nr:MiaB/RimO family radical SAM methylthiotransferase [Tidjanibacter sp.]
MELKDLRPLTVGAKKLYVETYGCQMNVGDSEIIIAVMNAAGYGYTERIEEADVILVNTCSVRDNAEQRIWGRLREFRRFKRQKPSLIVGVVGCMAERLKEELLEGDDIVNLVAGPDAYRTMPALVAAAEEGEKSVNVQLSREETYGDLRPVRIDKSGVSAFISIMRGCNNMCSYCVVPYTRGVERSRDYRTILREAQELFEAGYREVTLLGQNVNSYRYSTPEGEQVDFPALMEMVAHISPALRVRFSTSHPKDLSDKLLEVMAANANICRAIHLP